MCTEPQYLHNSLRSESPSWFFVRPCAIICLRQKQVHASRHPGRMESILHLL